MERAHARRYVRTTRQRKPPENSDRTTRVILRQVAACVALFALAMLLGGGQGSRSEAVKTNLQSALTQNVNLADLSRSLEEFVEKNPALSRIFGGKAQQTFNPSAGGEGDEDDGSDTTDGSGSGDAGEPDGREGEPSDGTEPTSAPPQSGQPIGAGPVYMTAVVKTNVSDAAANGDEALNPRVVSASGTSESEAEALPSDAYNGGANLPVRLYMPVEGVLTSPFGYRQHPITGERAFHYGIDIAAAYGSRILAAAEGTVLETGTDRVYGKYVILDHGNGVTTLYGHCSKLLVKAGKKVTRTTAVALMGSSGISTGTHLHFEIRNGGIKVNPLLNLTE